MPSEEPIIRVNFTISSQALAAIESMRIFYENEFAVKTCAVMVGWGEFTLNNGGEFQDVIVTSTKIINTNPSSMASR